eukprot:COSAG03_NODE_8426_length_804_cov_1.114894_3_plen_78_part_01
MCNTHRHRQTQAHRHTDTGTQAQAHRHADSQRGAGADADSLWVGHNEMAGESAVVVHSIVFGAAHTQDLVAGGVRALY